MQTLSIAILALAGLVPSAVQAKGINCEGSELCNLVQLNQNTAGALANLIFTQVDDNRWYDNGQLVACWMPEAVLEAGVIPICAFLQNTDGAWGSNIKGLANQIPNHGCTVCSSVPYFYPSDNNVADGELTFNAVSNPNCNENSLC